VTRSVGRGVNDKVRVPCLWVFLSRKMGGLCLSSFLLEFSFFLFIYIFLFFCFFSLYQAFFLFAHQVCLCHAFHAMGKISFFFVDS